jgi:hypothetical protein
MPRHLHIRSSVCASAALLWLLLSAEACVDPKGRYEDFIDRTADMRGRDAGMTATGERFDFSGRYLLALSTTLAPGQPILFACDISVASDLETLDLSIQPLTTDDSAMPREPVGDTLDVTGIAYAEDGTFSADFGEVTVPGEANPISGSDIVATVAITATAFPMDADLPNHFCGEATGMATVPLALDLAGSTFGAVETDDLASTDPLTSCP